MKDEVVKQEVRNLVARVCVGMVIGGLVAWRAVLFFREMDPLLEFFPTAVVLLTCQLAIRGVTEGALVAGCLGLAWDAFRTKGRLRFVPYLLGMFRLAVAVGLASALGRLAALSLGILWHGGFDPVDALAGWRLVQVVSLAVTAVLIPLAVRLMEKMAAAVARKALGMRILSFALPALALAALRQLPLVLLGMMTHPDRDAEEEPDPPPSEYRLAGDEWGEVIGQAESAQETER